MLSLAWGACYASEVLTRHAFIALIQEPRLFPGMGPGMVFPPVAASISQICSGPGPGRLAAKRARASIPMATMLHVLRGKRKV